MLVSSFLTVCCVQAGRQDGRAAALAQNISYYLISQPGASALRLFKTHHVTRRGTPPLFAPSSTAWRKKKMCVELRWDAGTEVVICAAAKHGVNNLPDGSLNRRGNRRSRAETIEPGGGGGFIPRTLPVRGASLRETNGVQRSRCCQSVMTGFSPPGCLARPTIVVSHQERRPTGDTHRSRPTCWEECKKATLAG